MSNYLKEKEAYLLRRLSIVSEYWLGPVVKRQYYLTKLLTWEKAGRVRAVIETVLSCAITQNSPFQEQARAWLRQQGQDKNRFAFAICLYEASRSKDSRELVAPVIAQCFMDLIPWAEEIWTKITLEQPVTISEILATVVGENDNVQDFPNGREIAYLSACTLALENPPAGNHHSQVIDVFNDQQLAKMPKIQKKILNTCITSQDFEEYQLLINRIPSAIQAVIELLTNTGQELSLPVSDQKEIFKALHLATHLHMLWDQLDESIAEQLKDGLLASPSELCIPLASSLLKGSNVDDIKRTQLLSVWAVLLYRRRRLTYSNNKQKVGEYYKDGVAWSFFQETESEFLRLLSEESFEVRADVLVEVGDSAADGSFVMPLRQSYLEGLKSPLFRKRIRHHIASGKLSEVLLVYYIQLLEDGFESPEGPLIEIGKWLKQNKPESKWVKRILTPYVAKHKISAGNLFEDTIPDSDNGNRTNLDVLVSYGYELLPEDATCAERVWKLLPKYHYYGGYKARYLYYRFTKSDLWLSPSWRTILLESGYVPRFVLASMLISLPQGSEQQWLIDNFLPFVKDNPKKLTTLFEVSICSSKLEDEQYSYAKAEVQVNDFGLDFVVKYAAIDSELEKKFQDYADKAFLGNYLSPALAHLVTEERARMLLFSLTKQEGNFILGGPERWLDYFREEDDRLSLKNWLLRHIKKLIKGSSREAWIQWVEAFGFHKEPAFRDHLEQFLSEEHQDKPAAQLVRLLQQ